MMKIEDFTPSDLDAVLDIETRSFRQPWGSTSFMTELTYTESIMLVMRGNETDRQQRVIGYLCGRLIGSEIYILKLAVSKNWRGCGIASQLLEEGLCRAAEKRTISAVLDVRFTNQPAISLYKKHGFQMVGRRPNYYLDTGEDALVMRKNLKEDI